MDKLKGLKVRNLMSTDVRTVEVPGQRLDALNIMKNNNISGLPVVEKGTKKYLGLITRHDIYDKPDKEQIAMLYMEDGASITAGSSVTTLVNRFLESGQYWMPVLQDGDLVGIVTPADFLKYLEHMKFEISAIDMIARHSCVPIHTKTPLSVALHILRITRFPALPVLDDKARLVGIVSDMDVFKILISEERTSIGMRLDVEDDDWTWEGIRNFNLIYAMPEVKLPDISMEQVMVEKVKFLYPHSDVAGAARTMRINNIGQLPVCDSNDVLVGMLYNYDLLKLLAPKN